MAEKSGPEPWAVGRLLATTSAFLKDRGSSTPRLDAELLLSEVLGLPKVQLYVSFERLLAPGELDAYRELVRRRSRSEPVAYILGRREFYGLNFKTTSAALIPRPETEHLVDEALRLARERWPDQPLQLADIGCGSGALGLALLSRLPGARLAAVDISPPALELAAENAAALNLADRADFFQGHLMEPLRGRRFHLICANLPYIPSAEMAGLMPDVGLHEPHLALDGGPEGLTLITGLIRQAADGLEPEGRVLLEIWPASLAGLEQEAGRAGFALDGEAVRDLSGRPRVAVLRRV